MPAAAVLLGRATPPTRRRAPAPGQRRRAAAGATRAMAQPSCSSRSSRSSDLEGRRALAELHGAALYETVLLVVHLERVGAGRQRQLRLDLARIQRSGRDRVAV